MIIRHLAMTILIYWTISSPVWAGPVLSNISGGSGPYPNVFGSNSTVAGDVIGFRFTADLDLHVIALGIMNDPDDGVLDSAHQVGLWDFATQNLLGAVSVDASGILIDDFYYETLGTPIDLVAGTVYVLGALYTYTDGDSYLSGPDFDMEGISDTAGVRPADADLGFVFPANVSSNVGRIGPNFIVGTSSVPEPGSLLLAGFGLLSLLLQAGKKRFHV